MKNVFIPASSIQYEWMFRGAGYDIVPQMREAQLVCFTGGADVHPKYYGEAPHPRSYIAGTRDEQEKAIFEFCVKKNIPMVGICRGGQFLHVMNGGKMWQNVDKHGSSHVVKDLWTKEEFLASSTHHQMMRPHRECVVVAVADNIATKKEAMSPQGAVLVFTPVEGEQDIEVVYWPETRCLCFQPHPEFVEASECRLAFFDYVTRYIWAS